MSVSGKKMRFIFILLLGVTLFLSLLDLVLGSVSVPITDIINLLLGSAASKPSYSHIVLDYRLPRLFTALLAGSALAVSGLKMQTLFQNPLAGPYVLGINAGASLGVALVVLLAGGMATTGFLSGFGLGGSLGMAFAAALGAGAVMGGIVLVSKRISDSTTLLILGLMFGYATSSLVNMLLHFSSAAKVRVFVAWTFGSFSGTDWTRLSIFAPVVLIGLGMALLNMKSLNALLLGEHYAVSMGLDRTKTRRSLIAGTALLAGSTTAFCGPIAFLGIAVPHLARALFNTSDHRILIPATALIGSLLAVLADLISQLPGSEAVLPVNSVTSVLGAPVIVWVVLRRLSLGSGGKA